MTRVTIIILWLFVLQAKWGYYGLPMNFFEPCDKNGKVSLLCKCRKVHAVRVIPMWVSSLYDIRAGMGVPCSIIHTGSEVWL